MSATGEVGHDLPVLETVDVSGDGGIVKEVLRQGEGEVIPVGSDVTVHYVGTLADEPSTKFDSSRDRGNDGFSFPLGQGQVIKGWDQGVATMKQGELARLICTAPYAYGDAGSGSTIKPGATLRFEVEVLSFVPKLTHEQAVEQAAKLKQEGNDAFKAGDLNTAQQRYHKAIALFDDRLTSSADDAQRTAINALLLPCYLNLAAVNLKQKDSNEALYNADRALGIDADNVKALFRRGQAHVNLSNFDQAKTDLYAAARAAPQDPGIRAAIAALKQKKADLAKKERAMFQKAFVGGIYADKKPEVADVPDGMDTSSESSGGTTPTDDEAAEKPAEAAPAAEPST